MAKKGQKFSKYSDELKNIVINEIESRTSIRYIAKKYKIPVGTVFSWSHKKNHPELSIGKRGRPKESDIDYKERYEILKKYHAFLKAQLERK